jgi:dTDP-4-dehydrorhamnose reductase
MQSSGSRPEIRDHMQVLRLIIVGASGVIGSALLTAARGGPHRIIGTALRRVRCGFTPFDMSKAGLRSVVPDLGPGDVVFLLAGYISPAWIFSNAEVATYLNWDCSKRLVDDVDTAGARVIFISTDQVFDGETGGYTEISATRPLNLYGRLKAAMESHVLATRNGVIVRTGWNVGWERGQHCPVSQCYETLLTAGAHMAHDNFFNVTDVEDTASGLLALAGQDPPARRIYHLVSAPEISRIELACLIKAESRWGPAMQFETVPFSSISYSEPRPTRAFLRSLYLPELGLTYSAPHDVIRRKVALLDRWRLEAGASRPRPLKTAGYANEFFWKDPTSGTIS